MTKMAAKWLKSIPNLWLKGLKNHILRGRTYLYSPYKGVPTGEEGYCEEYITDKLLIHHWQTTDILPTADRKVAIDTLTDIQCVVIASIDRHSIECQWKLKVCRWRCQPCANRGLTCQSSVDRGSIEVSIASIDRHSIAGVNTTWSNLPWISFHQFRLCFIIAQVLGLYSIQSQLFFMSYFHNCISYVENISHLLTCTHIFCYVSPWLKGSIRVYICIPDRKVFSRPVR